MPGSMTLNVRIGERLGAFVASNIGDDGIYDNASEYVRDLIRRDMQRIEDERLATLRTELRAAFAAPDDRFEPLDADKVLARNARDGA